MRPTIQVNVIVRNVYVFETEDVLLNHIKFRVWSGDSQSLPGEEVLESIQVLRGL